jgi:hypothetical protein
MARKNNAEQTENETVTDDGVVVDGPVVDAELPDGFESFGAEQTPFFAKEVGAVLHGELVGRFMRRRHTGKGSPFFYQFKVKQACKGTIGSKRKHTQEMVEVQPGELVSIDETETLKDLKEFADKMERGARYEIFLRFLRKRELDNGNSFWEVQKGHKVLQPPTSAADSIR